MKPTLLPNSTSTKSATISPSLLRTHAQEDARTISTLGVRWQAL